MEAWQVPKLVAVDLADDDAALLMTEEVLDVAELAAMEVVGAAELLTPVDGVEIAEVLDIVAGRIGEKFEAQ